MPPFIHYPRMSKNRNNKISLKELRTTFYHLRDFEISRLWERSIFLVTFLSIFTAGYGFLVNTLLTGDLKEIGTERILYIHEACILISLVAIVFSIIWIMMAKASKAWYEVYEQRIEALEKESKLKIDPKYRMTTEDYSPHKIDNCLFSTNAGPYSVSKINILIGQILLIIWTLLFVVHYGISIGLFCSNTCNKIHLFILCLLPAILGIIYCTACCNLWVKSSALTDKKG